MWDLIVSVPDHCLTFYLGRKVAYSLMGMGFHSVNGLKTCLNGHIWTTFVVPRLVYGLEIHSLVQKEWH